MLLLTLELAVQFFSRLLRLNYLKKGVTLSFGLVGHQDLLLQKLFFAGVVQVRHLFGFLLRICFFLGPENALVLFECSLGPERVDVGLSVCSLLLHLS
jgi:hypothetical protein